MDNQGKRWWKLEGDELAKHVFDLGCQLERSQEVNVQRAKASIELYSGRVFTGDCLLPTGGTLLSDEVDLYDLDYNLSRAGVNTVHAEIAGRQKPTAKFQTSGADWRTKRRAKRLEKYCSAQLYQRQGPYLNAWQLMESIFRDACITGFGACKVFSDDDRVYMERTHAWELFVDANEAKHGDPQNLFHVYDMDVDKAIEQFVDDPDSEEGKLMALEIESAGETKDSAHAGHPRVIQTVKIVEAWHLPCGGRGGRHVFSTADKLLYDEEWDRNTFPFVFIRWEEEVVGWRGIGLVEQGESMHREITYNAKKLQERFRLCGHRRIYYHRGSIDEKDLESNETEVFIPVETNAQFPQEKPPQPVSEAETMWLENNINFWFQMTGVSQMRASSRKEPGVTAGVAIRTLNDMQTARFALPAKAYENAYVQLVEQIIYCSKEMPAAKVKTQHGEEIEWSEVELPEDQINITIAPTSSLPNDPAGRMQMIQELYSAGVIGMETFKQLLGWPDLEKEMNNQTAQSRYLEKIFDSILDGEVAPNPEPLIPDKNMALMQAVQVYLEAMYDDAPEEVLQEMRAWIDGLDELIKDATIAAAEAQAEVQAAMQAKMGAMGPPQGAQPGQPPA